MEPTTPFDWIRDSNKKTGFIILCILTIVVMGCLQAINTPLISTQAPQGIVSFEFAKTIKAATSMVSSWDCEARIYAGISLGLDYLFVVLYAGALSLGCILVSGYFNSTLMVKTGLYLSWLPFLAALLDCMENFALIRILLGNNDQTWPLVSFYCAVPKFAIVIVGLFYILSGTFFRFYKSKA